MRKTLKRFKLFFGHGVSLHSRSPRHLRGQRVIASRFQRFVVLVLFCFFAPLSVSGNANADTILIGEVPFIAQSPPADWTKNKNCGPAAALMLAGFYNDFEPNAVDLKNELDWLYANNYIVAQPDAEYYDGNVTTTTILKSLLEKYFQLDSVIKKSGADWQFVVNQLKNGNPVIVGVNIQMNPNKLGHFVVAVGYDDDDIIVNDSGLSQGALKKYSFEKFFLSWQTSNNSVVYIDQNNVTWHPDGTLIKTADQPETYLLAGQEKHWIINEKVFKAHNFDWQKVIIISKEELACYADGNKIDWQPYREAFKTKDKYYLMEKSSSASTSCAIYEFGSEFSYVSWQLSAPLQELSGLDADQKYFSKCTSGGLLYVRDGTIVQSEFFVIGYNAGAKFVASGNGALLSFDADATFMALGYDKLPFMVMKENDEKGSYYGFGEMINDELAQQCFMKGFAIAGGNNEAVFETAVECPGLDCAEPIEPDPVETTPVEQETEETEPDAQEPVDSDPIETETTESEPSEPVEPEATDSESVEQAPIDSEPVEPESSESLPTEQVTIETASADSTAPEQPASDDKVICTVTCPSDMMAFIWFSESGEASGQPATMISTVEEICLRGQPWIDFDCACTKPWLWACFDPKVAQVECNREIQKVIPGIIDPKGEGEIWFTDFSCYQEN